MMKTANHGVTARDDFFTDMNGHKAGHGVFSRRQPFTLSELLMVIASIAILAAMLLPAAPPALFLAVRMSGGS